MLVYDSNVTVVRCVCLPVCFLAFLTFCLTCELLALFACSVHGCSGVLVRSSK